MLPRTSTTSNQSRLRRERDAVAIADSMASEMDLLELPTTSVFTYVWLVVIGLSLLRVKRSSTSAVCLHRRVILCKKVSTAERMEPGGFRGTGVYGISALTTIDLLDLDIRRLNHLRPFRDVFCDKLREGGGRTCEWSTA